jgi:hypothetical protein
MNLFNDTTLNNVFDSVAKKIKINNVLIPSIITNGALNKLDEQETKHIHTLERVNQGDIVDYEGNKYLVVTESMSKRHNKYKNIMEHMNMTVTTESDVQAVITDYDDFGKPIYSYISHYYDVPLVLRFDRVGSALTSGAFLTIKKALEGKVQKNEMNMTYLTVNKELTIEGSQYMITHVDKVQTGIMVLQLEYTT